MVEKRIVTGEQVVKSAATLAASLDPAKLMCTQYSTGDGVVFTVSRVDDPGGYLMQCVDEDIAVGPRVASAPPGASRGRG